MMKSGVTYIRRTAPSARMDTPPPVRSLLLLLLAVALTFTFAAGCASQPPSGGTVPPTTTEVQPSPTAEPAMDTCTLDSDCVPAQCCHPTSCINKVHKGVCNLFCTAVCSGPIDCGAGHCGCLSGTCQVIPGL